MYFSLLLFCDKNTRLSSLEGTEVWIIFLVPKFYFSPQLPFEKGCPRIPNLYFVNFFSLTILGQNQQISSDL